MTINNIGEKILQADHEEAVALLAGAAQHFTEALGAFLDGIMILKMCEISISSSPGGSPKLILYLGIEERIETHSHLLKTRGLAGLVTEHAIIDIIATAPTGYDPGSEES